MMIIIPQVKLVQYVYFGVKKECEKDMCKILGCSPTVAYYMAESEYYDLISRGYDLSDMVYEIDLHNGDPYEY